MTFEIYRLEWILSRHTFWNTTDKFIENTRNGVMYGEWNDNCRLLM